jgi:hypothetical protein
VSKNLRTALLFGLLYVLATPFLQSQALSKEYIRLGGRVIAVENSAGGSGPSLSVTPLNPTIAVGPYESISFTVSPPVGVTWANNPSAVGYISSSGIYQVPVCIAGQQSVLITATASGYQPGNSTITLVLPSGLSLPSMTVSLGVTQCTAISSITTLNSTVTINGSAQVVFQAGSNISLESGFHATGGTAGTTFHAKIQ